MRRLIQRGKERIAQQVGGHRRRHRNERRLYESTVAFGALLPFRFPFRFLSGLLFLRSLLDIGFRLLDEVVDLFLFFLCCSLRDGLQFLLLFRLAFGLCGFGHLVQEGVLPLQQLGRLLVRESKCLRAAEVVGSHLGQEVDRLLLGWKLFERCQRLIPHTAGFVDLFDELGCL